MGLTLLKKQSIYFFNALSEGTVPVDQNDVVLGQAMARNLGVGLGEEIVVLGSQKEGGIAALVLSVVESLAPEMFSMTELLPLFVCRQRSRHLG